MNAFHNVFACSVIASVVNLKSLSCYLIEFNGENVAYAMLCQQLGDKTSLVNAAHTVKPEYNEIDKC